MIEDEPKKVILPLLEGPPGPMFYHCPDCERRFKNMPDEPDPILVALAKLAAMSPEQYERHMKFQDEFVQGMQDAINEGFEKGLKPSE